MWTHTLPTVEPQGIIYEQISINLTWALSRGKNGLLKFRAGSLPDLPAQVSVLLWASVSPLGKRGTVIVLPTSVPPLQVLFFFILFQNYPLRHILAEALGPAFL